MLAGVSTMSLRGIDGYSVVAEVFLTSGLPSYNVVGLPDAAVKEAKERVAAALKVCGFKVPPKRITVNLAPAEKKKTGTHFDLPIALGLIFASSDIPAEVKLRLEHTVFLGELALDGGIRPVTGVLPMLLALRGSGKTAIVPIGNSAEAAASGIKCFGAENLKQVFLWLKNEAKLIPCEKCEYVPEAAEALDFADIKGQNFAKRAMEIAAAGFHNILLSGPPGSGKSMLAKRFPALLPPMSEDESLETTKIYSVSGLLKPGSIINHRPFREPHHTISDAALIGGGSNPRPGEVSLAHNGVLFLDEFPEFSRAALESLREPMESWKVSVSRVRENVVYPARFLLVAAMNPCPCGYLGHPSRDCSCTPLQISRYRSRISGPIFDRIDIQIRLLPIRYSDWGSAACGEKTKDIAERVLYARQQQIKRFGKSCAICSNAFMSLKDIKRFCVLPHGASEVLSAAMDKLGFSARSLDKILRVARTIADLEGCADIKKAHIMEAVQYRMMDRSNLQGVVNA